MPWPRAPEVTSDLVYYDECPPRDFERAITARPTRLLAGHFAYMLPKCTGVNLVVVALQIPACRTLGGPQPAGPQTAPRHHGFGADLRTSTA